MSKHVKTKLLWWWFHNELRWRVQPAGSFSDFFQYCTYHRLEGFLTNEPISSMPISEKITWQTRQLVIIGPTRRGGTAFAVFPLQQKRSRFARSINFARFDRGKSWRERPEGSRQLIGIVSKILLEESKRKALSHAALQQRGNGLQWRYPAGRNHRHFCPHLFWGITPYRTMCENSGKLVEADRLAIAANFVGDRTRCCFWFWVLF